MDTLASSRAQAEPVGYEGPATPDDDEMYGPEPDDPRAAGAYGDPYDVPDYDPAYEQAASCCERGEQ